MTASKKASLFKITSKFQDSVVYLVQREDEESFVCIGSQNIEDAIVAEWEGDCGDLTKNCVGEIEGYWHDLAMGDSMKVRCREIPMYGVKS